MGLNGDLKRHFGGDRSMWRDGEKEWNWQSWCEARMKSAADARRHHGEGRLKNIFSGILAEMIYSADDNLMRVEMIGRVLERKSLMRAVESNESQFVAVYGRCRTLSVPSDPRRPLRRLTLQSSNPNIFGVRR